MRLLFDEHLSPKLPGLLADVFPNCASIFELGLGGGSDKEILEYANKCNFLVVSKDRDFLDMILQSQSTAKLVWIRLGNSSTASIHLLLRNQSERVLQFSRSSDVVLELP